MIAGVQIIRLALVRALVGLSLLICSMAIQAQNYTLPGGPLPPGCSISSGAPSGFDASSGLNFAPELGLDLSLDPAKTIVVCTNGVALGGGVNIFITQPTELILISGDFSYFNNRSINAGGSSQDLVIRLLGGSVLPTAAGANLESNATWIVSGTVSLSNNATSVGDIFAANVTLGHNGIVSTGDIYATASVTNNGTVQGSIDAAGAVNNSGVVTENVNARGSVMNTGSVGGYINAPTIANFGTAQETCFVNSGFGPCAPTAGPDPVHHYRITHGGIGLSCEPYPLTITACANASCGTTVNITGSVTVQAGSFSATGNFSNSATLSLSLAITNPGTYSLAVSAATVATSQTPSPAWVCPTGCGVNISTAALLWDNIGPQVAGQPFAAALRAVRAQADPAAACVADVTGPRQVQLGVQCLDPATCLEGGTLARAGGTALTAAPGSVAVSLTFDGNGRAEVPGGMRYDDAGRIRFTASTAGNSGATLSGNSNDFVVRPASIAVTVSGPGGYGGGVLARAGDDLLVTLTALNALGVATRNFGNESAPAARLELSGGVQVTAPAGGVPGQLQNTSNFSPSGNGSFARNDVRYLEVGEARFEARVVGGSYLGVAAPPSLGPAHGRFVPWHFALDMGTVQPFCSGQTPGFSYMEQSFELASLRFSARNRDDAVTVNYPHVHAASSRLFAAGRDADDNLVDLSVRLDPTTQALSWSDGLSEEISLSMLLERLDVDDPDGPYSEFQLAVRLNDLEPTGPYTPMRDPDFSVSDGEDCALDDSCNLVMLGLSQSMVFGRLIMPDVFGPETESLEVSLRSYYWNGSDFQPWTRDSCSVLDSNNLQLVANPQSLGTSAQGGSSTMLNGRSADGSAYWTAPDASGRIEFLYEVPDWFKFGTDNNGDPGASGEFGRFRGHDSIIEWRRVFP